MGLGFADGSAVSGSVLGRLLTYGVENEGCLAARVMPIFFQASFLREEVHVMRSEEVLDTKKTFLIM